MGDIEFLFVLLLAAALLVRLADVVAVPYPIVLVFGGLAIGAVPGLPDVRLEPEVVFLVFLPPLLHAAAWSSSARELRVEVRPLAFLALGLVLATTAIVAVVAHALVEGMSWPAAFVLGAVVAPTDPVAATASFARLGAPERVKLLIEGEAMINDASALTAYRVALAAAATGSFAAGEALLDFAVSAAGGVAVGLLVGWLSVQVIRHLPDRALTIFFTVIVAYAGYIGAEELGVSGVLGTVVAGLYASWHSHRTFDADSRLSAAAFWEVLVFALNAMLFVLLGLEFPGLLDELEREVSIGALAGAAALVALTVMVVRLGWMLVPGAGFGDNPRERLVVGWSGMRGAISLAAALSVPASVDERPEIVFVAFAVVLVTLVGQGLTLPALLGVLGLKGDRPWSPDEAIARLEAAQAALDRLDDLEDEGADDERLRRLRELYRARFRQCMAVMNADGGVPPAEDDDPRLTYGALRRELIHVERASLIGLRDDGRLKVETLRLIERDLDLDEARLRT